VVLLILPITTFEIYSYEIFVVPAAQGPVPVMLIVIALLVAVVGLAQAAFEVRTQVTI
jgi:hypothetical protein